MATTLAPNSAAAIQERVGEGRITWTAPLAMTVARTALILLVQAIIAAGFYFSGSDSPWRAQAPYWTVYATLIDIGCLLLLARASHKEGIRLRDLFGVDLSSLGREALWGLALMPVCFGSILIGSILASLLVYGTAQPHMEWMAPGLLTARHVPSWAVIYSVTFFWLIWSPTEEVIYQGYCAARLRALTGKTWITVALVGFWWAIQHSVFPLAPGWQLFIYRFLQFVPLVVVMQLLYLRTRKLPRFILAHWAMDLFGAYFTLAAFTGPAR